MRKKKKKRKRRIESEKEREGRDSLIKSFNPLMYTFLLRLSWVCKAFPRVAS